MSTLVQRYADHFHAVPPKPLTTRNIRALRALWVECNPGLDVPETARLRNAYYDNNAGMTPEQSLQRMIDLRAFPVGRDDETGNVTYRRAQPDDDPATTDDVRFASERTTVPDTFLTKDETDAALTVEPDFPHPETALDDIEDDALLTRVQGMVDLDKAAMSELTLESTRVLLADYQDAMTIHNRRATAAAKAYQRLSDLLHDISTDNAS